MRPIPERLKSTWLLSLWFCSATGLRSFVFQRAAVRLKTSVSADPSLSLSPLVSSITESKTLQVHAMTVAMKGRGEEVISLVVGEPDFLPPQTILDATAQAAACGETRYTANSGSQALRQAICDHLTTRKGTVYRPNEVLVTNGAKQACFQAILATCRPGDEVIIPAPYWPSYPEMVKFAGATPVIVETKVEDGFLLKPEALAAAITSKTRALIFCNPSNPTGNILYHKPTFTDSCLLHLLLHTLFIYSVNCIR